MKPRHVGFIVAIAVAAVALGWLLFVGLPRWYGGPSNTATTAAPAAPTGSEDSRKITARLFYVSEDGTRLTSVEREVPYGDQPAAQARRIVEAQLAPVQPPLVSAIPAGTTLRAMFLNERGVAVVDLSREVAAAHTGGSTNELLTIYTLVQALTTNLPAVSAVQLLVDGKEVDTLAGHVDIKRPLARADAWVTEPVAPPSSTPPGTSAPSDTSAAAPAALPAAQAQSAPR
jgi:spore germination protein GerM